MMDILIKRMRLADLNSVLLEVRKSNHAAQSFYEKLDFERRKDYYKTQNNEAIMTTMFGYKFSRCLKVLIDHFLQ